jgi:hypothetical protein
VSFANATNLLSIMSYPFLQSQANRRFNTPKGGNALTNQSLCAPMEEHPLGRDLSLPARSGQNLVLIFDWVPLEKETLQ